ncbi:MAG: 4-hydroxy-tetrahydrodipicolinate synthase [Oscillatoriales cyanobacterium]|nr:MAG: 4-hydroxy-tetrahydrodipicolinate synthase [Oscillatoriales cyanobacterium]
MIDFGTVLTAMVTPMGADGSVNYDVTARLADDLVRHGSDTILVCGTTGESPTLTWDEEFELFRVVRDAVAGRAKVMAGTGSNSTREAIEATQKAAAIGLDGSLQVVPYYNKPPQAGLLAHFQAIASACPEFPLMLYNIPGRTGADLLPDTVAKLAEVSNIVAIKEASGSIDRVARIRRQTPAEFAIYSGDDGLTLPLMAVGARGVVSVASHLIGDDLQRAIAAFVTGDPATATALHLKYMPLFDTLFATTNPIPVKCALRLMGWDVGECRLPLSITPPEIEAQMRSVLQDLNLLPSE